MMHGKLNLDILRRVIEQIEAEDGYEVKVTIVNKEELQEMPQEETA